MNGQENNFMKQIQEWVVNDYFTPNIKAEVVLDTLLTPYVQQILQNECGIAAAFLTKEMSLEKTLEEATDDMGHKIDYLLVGEHVYLVELKTTAGSMDAGQAKHYLDHCCKDGKPMTFGEVFGEKLVRIINKTYNKKSGNLKAVFQEIVGGCGNGEHAACAREFLKKENLESTNKYLYTAGQILDRHPDLDALWKKEVRLLYITPDGRSPHASLLQADGFYLRPNGNDMKSICLRDAVQNLKPEDDYVMMLKGIANDIYPV